MSGKIKYEDCQCFFCTNESKILERQQLYFREDNAGSSGKYSKDFEEIPIRTFNSDTKTIFREKDEAILFKTLYGFDAKEKALVAESLVKKFGWLAHIINLPAEIAYLAVEDVVDEEKFTNLWRMMESDLDNFDVRRTKACQSSILSYLFRQIGLEKTEVFLVLFLDAQMHMISSYRYTDNDPRKIEVNAKMAFRNIFSLNPHYCVLAHNHPNYHAYPSSDDLSITKKYVNMASTLGVIIADHYIVSKQGYYSFRENHQI